MTRPRTQSRAIQLAIYDMNEKGKPTDAKIAEEWGLGSARQVRELRSSEEYRVVLTELQTISIQYAADRVGKIAAKALEQLEELLPQLAAAAAVLLSAQPLAGGGNVRLDPRDVSTANSVVRTLMELSAVKNLNETEVKEEKSAQVLPNLKLAQSETAVLKAYRAEVETGTVVDGEYTVTPPARELDA